MHSVDLGIYNVIRAHHVAPIANASASVSHGSLAPHTPPIGRLEPPQGMAAPRAIARAAVLALQATAPAALGASVSADSTESDADLPSEPAANTPEAVAKQKAEREKKAEQKALRLKQKKLEGLLAKLDDAKSVFNPEDHVFKYDKEKHRLTPQYKVCVQNAGACGC